MGKNSKETNHYHNPNHLTYNTEKRLTPLIPPRQRQRQQQQQQQEKQEKQQ